MRRAIPSIGSQSACGHNVYSINDAAIRIILLSRMVTRVQTEFIERIEFYQKATIILSIKPTKMAWISQISSLGCGPSRAAILVDELPRKFSLDTLSRT